MRRSHNLGEIARAVEEQERCSFSPDFLSRKKAKKIKRFHPESAIKHVDRQKKAQAMKQRKDESFRTAQPERGSPTPADEFISPKVKKTYSSIFKVKRSKSPALRSKPKHNFRIPQIPRRPEPTKKESPLPRVTPVEENLNETFTFDNIMLESELRRINDSDLKLSVSQDDHIEAEGSVNQSNSSILIDTNFAFNTVQQLIRGIDDN